MAEAQDDDAILESFALPPEGREHPATIAARVMQMDEHKHLAEHDVSFLWLMRNTEHIQAGRRVLAMVHEPQVQGRLRDLFEHLVVKQFGFMPQFIVTVDADWWRDATPQHREALVFHELCHVKPALDKFGEPRFNKLTGEPIFALVAHDLEEFNAVVERYGEWKSDITAFREALESHG